MEKLGLLLFLLQHIVKASGYNAVNLFFGVIVRPSAFKAIVVKEFHHGASFTFVFLNRHASIEKRRGQFLKPQADVYCIFPRPMPQQYVRDCLWESKLKRKVPENVLVLFNKSRSFFTISDRCIKLDE